MLQRYVKKILAARVYDVAEESELSPAPLLSHRLGNEVLFKREDTQPVFSFKLRGAYNRMVQLSPEALERGVITASAGNHAQGVALAARELNCPATIVMGVNTPDIKINAVRARGARVVLHGDTYNDAARHAQALQAEHGYTYVHPFDDPDVIAGQGTIGVELLHQCPDLNVIFVPVGGGGLLAGIAAYVKYLRPEIKVIGVEAEGSACLAAARAANRRVRLRYEDLDLFADGVSVAQVGKETFRVIQRCINEPVLTVSTDEICGAIRDVFDDTRSIAEPAGALAVAGMKKWVEQTGAEGLKMAAIVSGANVNFDRLRHISERAEVGEHREAVLAVMIPEKPGSFRRFCRTLGKRNITEFNYRYSHSGAAQVFVGLQIRSSDDRQQITERLLSEGYSVEDMTDNEMAKLHVRHMVGGRAPVDERLFRVEFPERPGALLRFLSGLPKRWNISLFHYRNHGSAWGRVLVGLQVPSGENAAIPEFFSAIGYRYWEETENAAYQRFLRTE